MDLESNQIGDDGASILADGLKTNLTLKRLNLKSNQISDDGAKVFCKTLETNRTLTKLDLTDNEIYDDGAKALHRGFKANCSLTVLEIEENNIDDMKWCDDFDQEGQWNTKIVAEIKTFLINKYLTISLKKSSSSSGQEKMKKKNEDEDEDNDEECYDRSVKRRRMSLSSSPSRRIVSSSSISSSIKGGEGGGGATEKGNKKENENETNDKQQFSLPDNIIKHISKFMDWDDLKFTKKTYKLSPILTILPLLVKQPKNNHFYQTLPDNIKCDKDIMKKIDRLCGIKKKKKN